MSNTRQTGNTLMKVGLVIFLLGFSGCSYEFIRWDNGNSSIGNASFWVGLVGLAVIVAGIVLSRKSHKEVIINKK